MDSRLVDQVCAQVYQRFPAFSGSRPQVKPYAEGQFLLVFQTSSRTADGRSLDQTVRVVASADGKVRKMTASR